MKKHGATKPKYDYDDTIFICGKEEKIACSCWMAGRKTWCYGIQSEDSCDVCYPEDEINNFSLSQILKGLINDE